MTKSKLREIIREEIQKLNEADGKAKLKKMIQMAKKAGAKKYDIIKFLASNLSKSEDEIVKSLEKYNLIRMTESISESDFPTTTKKGKTVTVVHKKSGKELVVVDKPHVIKKYKRMGYLVNEGKKVVKAKTVKRTRHQNQRQVAQELIKKLKRKGWKVPQYLSDTSTLEKQIINAYEKARKKWDSTMGDTVILSVSDNKDFTDKNFKWVKESANEAIKVNTDKLLKNPKISKLLKKLSIVKLKSKEDIVKVLNYFAANPHILATLKTVFGESINEANFRQGDKFELGKDLDYGDEKLHAGDYEVVKARGPHQYQLKDTHSGKQFTLHKKDFEKYAKKKQFKQINEAGMFDDYYELNPAYLSKFIKSYKKLNSKNLVKKKGDYTYGFRKGEREAHWKYDDDYKLHYDIDKAKALGLINFFNKAKKDHPWG